MEASVFSIPHERLVETVGAAVYAIEPPKLLDVQQGLEATLARFKIPEKLWIYTEPLPRGATEKIDKRGIREACLAGTIKSFV